MNPSGLQSGVCLSNIFSMNERIALLVDRVVAGIIVAALYTIIQQFLK